MTQAMKRITLTAPRATGQRFIAATSEPIEMASIAAILRQAGYTKVPTRKAPTVAVRLMALFDRQAKGMLPLLGKKALLFVPGTNLVELEAVLKDIGFTTHRLPFGDIDNLYARIGDAAPHFCFAGHSDVVPVGDLSSWTIGPFAAELSSGYLFGRAIEKMFGGMIESAHMLEFLGLGMLGCMRRAFMLLAKHRGIDHDLGTIPPEDPATYAMIRKADTLGTFQIESRAQMSMLPRLKPKNYYDLVIEVSIVRPGPISGGMVLRMTTVPCLRRRVTMVSMSAT